MTARALLKRLVVCGLVVLGASAAAQAQEPEPDAPQEQNRALWPAFGTTVGAAELDARRIDSLGELPSAVPAITLTPTQSSGNTPIFYMRGQGLGTPAQITRDGAVGVFEDGFYISRQQALMFDVLDLAGVEVLHGPQGAVYGRNTTGGVVNLVSAVPSGTLRLKESADYGSRNMIRLLSSLDTPEWHGLSAKATVLVRSIDGYVKNADPSQHAYGEEHQRAGRAQLRWNPVSTLLADYSLEKTNLDSTPDYLTNPSLNGDRIYTFFIFSIPYYANPYGPMDETYRRITLPLSTSDHVAHRLTLSWQPSTILAVHARTGYRAQDAIELQDYAESHGVTEQTADVYKGYELSQDLQAAGSAFDERVSYVLGGDYVKQRGWHDAQFTFTTFGQRTIEDIVLANTAAEAAYLQLRWRPRFARQRLELSAAARETWEVKKAIRVETDSASGTLENHAVNRFSERHFNPSGTLDYRWSGGLSTYAGVSTGYHAGGALETAIPGKFRSSTFRPETLISYELGLRSALPSDRLHWSVVAFSSRYRDVQYALPVTAVSDEVYRLQKATIRGADVDLTVNAGRNLTLSSAVAYLHSSVDLARVLPGTPLDPAAKAGSPYRVGENESDLFVLPYAPKYNLTAAADYVLWRGFTADARLHVDYGYRGQFYTDPAAGRAVPGRQFAATPASGALNPRLQLTTEADRDHHVKLGFWGRNVLHRKYYAVTNGYGNGVAGFSRSAKGVEAPMGWRARLGAWAEPATYGVNVSYEY